jgi:hypothetical protein
VLWVCLLLLLAVGLETLTQRPFLATLWGRMLGGLLGGTAASSGVIVVARLPAVGFRAAAQTWGDTVLVTPELMRASHAPRTLAHEACHVTQYRRLTSLGFWLVYLAQWVYGLVRYRNAFRAYWEIPLEREARSTAENAQA